MKDLSLRIGAVALVAIVGAVTCAEGSATLDDEELAGDSSTSASAVGGEGGAPSGSPTSANGGSPSGGGSPGEGGSTGGAPATSSTGEGAGPSSAASSSNAASSSSVASSSAVASSSSSAVASSSSSAVASSAVASSSSGGGCPPIGPPCDPSDLATIAFCIGWCSACSANGVCVNSMCVCQ